MKLGDRRIEIRSGPDKQGRYSYTLFCVRDYPPNTFHEKDFDGQPYEGGQCFFGDPFQHGVPDEQITRVA